MNPGIAQLMNSLKKVALMALVTTIASCGDDNDPSVIPEPVVFNFRYLSVEVTSPAEEKSIQKVTFNADDLKTYSYILYVTGSRRINCSSNTFIDTDDAVVTEDSNSITTTTDPDAVFDVVDLNGNIARFTPSITGATNKLIHGAGSALTGDARSEYLAEVTKKVNRLPNEVFEILE